MKSLVIWFSLCFYFCSLYAQTPDAITGKWYSSSGSAQIQIYKKGEEYHGKIVWLKNPHDEKGKPKTDIKNPDPALRNRAAIGLEILRDFKYQGNGVWEEGTVYDPKSGKTYSCKMTLADDGTLNIRGYVGVSLLGRTETWNRAK